MLAIRDLSKLYKGALIPHLITQELISLNTLNDKKPNFWVREKKQASISVVLPARNASATLPTAVDSVLAQSIDDFELVLVDHSSTDD